MRRKTAAELQREAAEIQHQARVLRAQEAKKERVNARYRQTMLGACVQHAMKSDPALRSSMRALMDRFCKRARDRELFGFDQSISWFDGFDAPDQAGTSPPRTASAGKVDAARGEEGAASGADARADSKRALTGGLPPMGAQVPSAIGQARSTSEAMRDAANGAATPSGSAHASASSASAGGAP